MRKEKAQRKWTKIGLAEWKMTNVLDRGFQTRIRQDLAVDRSNNVHRLIAKSEPLHNKQVVAH